jgi:hypothetical protein
MTTCSNLIGQPYDLRRYARQQTYILDATEKYNKYGEFASRIQGKQSLIRKWCRFHTSKFTFLKHLTKETLETKFAMGWIILQNDESSLLWGIEEYSFKTVLLIYKMTKYKGI